VLQRDSTRVSEDGCGFSRLFEGKYCFCNCWVKFRHFLTIFSLRWFSTEFYFLCKPKEVPLLLWPILETETYKFMIIILRRDGLCDLVVRVPQSGDVLCFLWGTNWIYICYVEESRTPVWFSGQSSWLHNGNVLWLLWGTNWIYICYVEESRPPLRSSGQSSWRQIQRSGFDSRRYQIFWEVVGLEQGPLRLVSKIEELLGRKSSCSGAESREYGIRDSSSWPRGTLYP
jgi:hypothetical protein